MLSFNPKHLERLLIPIMWVLGFVISGVYLVHFQNTNNDFQVFMKAGNYFLEGENSWSEFSDPNAMYLNGSGTLILSSFLSLIPIEYGLLLLRIANILAVMVISFRIGRKSHPLSVPAIFILFMIIFPFRSAMEYGQFTILFTFLAFFLLLNALNKDKDSLWTGLALALIIDFKPHIFIGVIAILLLQRRFMLLLKAFCLWLIIQIAVGWWSHTIPIYEWYLAIKRRSQFVSRGEDNLSLVSSIGSFRFFFAILFSMIVIYFLWRNFQKSKGSHLPFLEIITLSLVLTPLLHPTDLLLVALIIIWQFDFTVYHSFVLGLFLVWSPRPSGAIFTLATVTIVFLVALIQNKSIGKIAFLTLIAPYLCYLFAVEIGVYEVSVRHFLQQLILAAITLRYLKINRIKLQPA